MRVAKAFYIFNKRAKKYRPNLIEHCSKDRDDTLCGRIKNYLFIKYLSMFCAVSLPLAIACTTRLAPR